jgi:hypothetical protein
MFFQTQHIDRLEGTHSAAHNAALQVGFSAVAFKVGLHA